MLHNCRAYVYRTQLDQQQKTTEMVTLNDSVPSIILQNHDQILLHPRGYEALCHGSPLTLRIGKRFITVRIPVLTVEARGHVLALAPMEILS